MECRRIKHCQLGSVSLKLKYQVHQPRRICAFLCLNHRNHSRHYSTSLGIKKELRNRDFAYSCRLVMPSGHVNGLVDHGNA